MQTTQDLTLNGVTLTLSVEASPEALQSLVINEISLKRFYEQYGDIREEAFPGITQTLNKALIDLHERTSSILSIHISQRMTRLFREEPESNRQPKPTKEDAKP
ncbi:hypothetical protein [Oceanospirillum maris]|uniref:hypothetical protein n=1 Tax=Oceanospirillum maris TaxID=64977 RepID=UPI000406AB5D|nr:hypothetical protein [Oceanospirillum maris]